MRLYAAAIAAARHRRGGCCRTGAGAGRGLFWAPRSQTYLSASYRLSSAASLIAQVGNLTHRGVMSLTGPGMSLLKDRYSMPTCFWVGLRLTQRCNQRCHAGDRTAL